MSDKKKRHGDRVDATYLRDLDAMHYVMPVVMPDRIANEAYLSIHIETAPLNAYLEKKNAGEEEFPYTFFHLIVTAILKTIMLRPNLNRFIGNKSVYMRDEVSAAFVVKKQFSDDSEEALAYIVAKPDDTVESIHGQIFQIVSKCRSGPGDKTTDNMEVFKKMPRWLTRFLVWIVCKLDKHGRCPAFLKEDNPYYASIFLSNLGSIKLECGYHHLSNFGTNSIFCIVGRKHDEPEYKPDGSYTLHEVIDLGLTVDERIADGYYYAKSIKLFKKLMEDPALLERPLAEEVDYE